MPDGTKNPRFLRITLCAGVLLVGCASESELVELRLFPCDTGGLPRALTLEITPLDEDGQPMGEVVLEQFDDIATAVFDDDYATVGWKVPGGATNAAFRVGWFSAASAGDIDDADALAEYEEPVPSPGSGWPACPSARSWPPSARVPIRSSSMLVQTGAWWRSPS